MALPTFTMRQLLEAGVHFGHQAGRWNPKMEPYLYGVRNNVHIIDLRQTVPMLYRAMETIRDIVGSGGRVLFVGTKRQASDAIRTAASRSGQYYVDHRWLGGMLTNWTTMSRSIKRLQVVEEQLAGDDTTGLTKKELLRLMRERDRLDRALGGIKDMGGLPDILFVVDTNKEEIAVKEARKLNIPIVAVLDSNSDPDGITYPIPGNDDALRAITMYCELISGAVLDGIQQELAAAGADIGEAEELPADELAAAEQAGGDEATEPAEDAPAEEAKAEPEEEAKQPTADEAEDAPEGAEAAKDEATAEASEKAADGDQAEAKPGGDEAEATPAGGETAAEAGEETGEDKAASA